MSPLEPALPGTSAEELRRSFDASFARPHPATADGRERLLAVRIAGESFALPMQGKSVRISGLATDRIPARLPNQTPAFVGVIAVRGEIFPAFDLAALAGLSGGGQRWWALLLLPEPAAIAFEALDGLLELPANRLMPRASGPSEDHPLALVERIARLDDRLVPVLDLDALGDAIRRPTVNPGPS